MAIRIEPELDADSQSFRRDIDLAAELPNSINKAEVAVLGSRMDFENVTRLRIAKRFEILEDLTAPLSPLIATHVLECHVIWRENLKGVDQAVFG